MKTQDVIQYIVNWLNDYADKANVKGFVVGVSGGVDSAVVSTLCAKTGREVLCLNMPIRQHPDQLDRASQHIRHLEQHYPNVRSQLLDLTPTFEQFERSVSGSLNLPNSELAMANTRSRLRMSTLYFYGQIHHLLVAGTGNKVEDFGVGFFTKYGDGGVDISPIGDLLKTQVYQLAQALQVSQAIQTAAPTDGLWDSEERTDEQQIGATYPELERAMAQFEMGVSREELQGRELAVFDIFVQRHRATLHKIQPIPVCQIPREYFQAA